MEEDKEVKPVKFKLPKDVVIEVAKLAESLGLTTDQALLKFVQLGLWLSSFRTGEVTVYVRKPDGSEEKIYPVL